MKLYHLKRSLFIQRPIKEVFSFFEQPENLTRITPEDMGFQILTPSPISMRAGSLIDYTVRIMGIRSRWTTLITDYDPPHRFVDLQLKGSYSFWHHTHRFQEENGGTRILDHVRYMMPLGFMGRLIHALLVRKQLKQVFDFREQVISRYFSGGTPGVKPVENNPREAIY